MMADDSRQKIIKLLHRLGINENYKGFFPTVYAVQLVIRDPSRLQLITKLVYPDAARHCGGKWQNVERNMRTVAAAAWAHNSGLLSELAGRPLPNRPDNAQLLAILARSCSGDEP